MAIVCGIDFSDASRVAADAAVSLGKRLGEPVVLAAAIDPVMVPVSADALVAAPIPYDTLEKEAKQMLRALEIDAAERRTLPGPADDALMSIAAEKPGSIIAVGSHGSRPIRWLLGSVCDRLLRRSSAPILVAPAKGPGGNKVLVALDFDECAEGVLDLAAKLAAHGAEIHLVHAFLPAPALQAVDAPVMRLELERNTLAEMERRLSRGKLSIPPERLHLVGGKPAAAVSRFAAENGFGLIIAGTHGRKGLPRALIGSVADGIVRRAERPVLVVPCS
jgi:nucleotide-binding universal stress UspA family protein